jgi:hypothetical protein
MSGGTDRQDGAAGTGRHGTAAVAAARRSGWSTWRPPAPAPTFPPAAGSGRWGTAGESAGKRRSARSCSLGTTLEKPGTALE